MGLWRKCWSRIIMTSVFTKKPQVELSKEKCIIVDFGGKRTNGRSNGRNYAMENWNDWSDM